MPKSTSQAKGTNLCTQQKGIQSVSDKDPVPGVIYLINRSLRLVDINCLKIDQIVSNRAFSSHGLFCDERKSRDPVNSLCSSALSHACKAVVRSAVSVDCDGSCCKTLKGSRKAPSEYT